MAMMVFSSCRNRGTEPEMSKTFNIVGTEWATEYRLNDIDNTSAKVRLNIQVTSATELTFSYTVLEGQPSEELSNLQIHASI